MDLAVDKQKTTKTVSYRISCCRYQLDSAKFPSTGTRLTLQNMDLHQIICLQVFLRGGQMAVLDTMRTDIMHKAAVNIQRHVRGFVVRRKVHRIVRAVIKMQVTLFTCDKKLHSSLHSCIS